VVLEAVEREEEMLNENQVRRIIVIFREIGIFLGVMFFAFLSFTIGFAFAFSERGILGKVGNLVCYTIPPAIIVGYLVYLLRKFVRRIKNPHSKRAV
jgi:hypothetical protein